MENNIIFINLKRKITPQFHPQNVIFFLIIEPKMPCLIGGGSCDFQPSFRGGSLRFAPIGRGGSCVF